MLTGLLSLIPWSFRAQVKRIPGLAQLQRILVRYALDGKDFAHRVDAGPAKGITFPVRMPEDKGIWTGTYEQALATRLATAVKPGLAAYDIGSWHGFFAGVMAANGASEVHAFEPLPENVARLRTLIELNPTARIVLHECAVGDSDGEMNLLVMPETSMAKLETSTFQGTAQAQARVSVPVRSLDDMVADGTIPLPGLIKIDVEGAELLVLNGGKRVLQSARPEVFAEVHSSTLLERCESFFKSIDYRIEHLGDPADARMRDVFQIRAFPTKSH